ncbi:serine hydrolase domain-containing protein [Yeosuana marina]|uniref:serine hydrolase domain-containing protein n=1 Tax=Yeosuana marina TaxID=1565536 RepID=UPI00141EAA1D|nr:serine hydrolase domain-containing protein [Yeosuana marina]
MTLNSKLSKKLFLIILFLGFKLGAQNELKISNSEKQQINKIFESFDSTKIPGINIGIVKDEQLIFQNSFGMANLEHQIPTHINSVFSLASVSKQFTAYGILLLESQGKLRLSDPIQKYLKDFPHYKYPITIQQLINHTSGIRSHLMLLGKKGYISDDRITKRDVKQVIYNQKELNFIPGTEFNYSNSGYFLLAEIIEKVAKQSFQEFLRENLFTPLKMNNSLVMDNYQKVVQNRAESYEIIDTKYMKSPANYSYYGSTGLFSTIKDIAKWAIYLNSNNDVISRSMNINSSKDNQYSNGQFFGTYKGLYEIQHTGSDAGYVAYLVRYPELRYAFILLSNNASVDSRGLINQVVDIILNDKFKQDKNKNQNQTSTNNFIDLDKEQLRKHEGIYINKDNLLKRTIKIDDKGNLNYIREESGRASKLNPIDENIFQLGDYQDLKVVFKNLESENKHILSILADNSEVESYEKFIPKKYSKNELSKLIGDYYSEELLTTYHLKVHEGFLTIFHEKMQSIQLIPISEDFFTTNSWQFNKLSFNRNKKNEIIGFEISSPRAKNIDFVKNNE